MTMFGSLQNHFFCASVHNRHLSGSSTQMSEKIAQGVAKKIVVCGGNGFLGEICLLFLLRILIKQAYRMR